MVRFSFSPPEISLGGAIELKEVSGNNIVDLEGSINLALSPPSKMKLGTDIFDWPIIAGSTMVAGPGGKKFGDFLVRVKAWAADKGVVVKVDFVATREIATKIEYKIEAEKNGVTEMESLKRRPPC